MTLRELNIDEPFEHVHDVTYVVYDAIGQRFAHANKCHAHKCRLNISLLRFNRIAMHSWSICHFDRSTAGPFEAFFDATAQRKTHKYALAMVMRNCLDAKYFFSSTAC